jgi:uncharacterized protein (TIGR00369 family)
MDDHTNASSPPEGFAEMDLTGEFWRMSGPFYQRNAANPTEQAFLAGSRYCNARGFVHGGMLSAFLDRLFSHAVAAATDRANTVTVHLSVDFLAAAKIDQWVVGESQVTRATRDVVFVEGRIHSGGRDVVRGSGVFKITRTPSS